MRYRFALWDDNDVVVIDPEELIVFLLKFYCRKGVAITITPSPLLHLTGSMKKPHLLKGADLLIYLIASTDYDVSRLCPKVRRLYERFMRGEVRRPTLIDWIV